MDACNETTDEPRFLNLLQVIVIDICLTAAVFGAAFGSGVSLGFALLAAWLGGAALTMALVAAIYQFKTRAVAVQATRVDAAASSRGDRRRRQVHVTEPSAAGRPDGEIGIVYSAATPPPRRRHSDRPPEVVAAERVSAWEEDAEKDAAVARPEKTAAGDTPPAVANRVARR